MRLLAIDPGSTTTGYAYFVDGELRRCDQHTPKGRDLSWLERAEAIATWLDDETRFDEVSRAAGVPWDRLPVDVLAIEETPTFRKALNPGFLLYRGYLIRVLTHELYPRAQPLEVNLATIKRALGLKGAQDRIARQRATLARFPGKRQDEADACAVGLGALLIAEERGA